MAAVSRSFFTFGKWTSTMSFIVSFSGKLDVVEEATAQERVRQLFFVVGGDDDDGAELGLNRFAGLVNKELHPIEFLQQIIREFDIGFVDFIDQQHDLLCRR